MLDLKLLNSTVQEMEGADGVPVAYITGGHVDLRTAIMRGGGVGSTWRYPPGQVSHDYLLEASDGSVIYAGNDATVPNGFIRSVPVTILLEPDNLEELTREAKSITVPIRTQ